MDIYDPIGIALGLEPMELSEVYNLPLQKIATREKRISPVLTPKSIAKRYLAPRRANLQP
jgi:hypothetical protein